MLRGSCTKFLACLTDVGLFASHAEQDIDNILGFAIHGLLNHKNIAVFHLNVVPFNNVLATLTVVASIVALSDRMFFVLHCEVRRREKKFEIGWLTTTGNWSSLAHDELHLRTLV